MIRYSNDVIMSTMASQITSVSVVCSTIGSGSDQRKYQSSASLAFVRGIHRWPVNSPHKRPVRRKLFPFDDVIMIYHDAPATSLYCFQVATSGWWFTDCAQVNLNGIYMPYTEGDDYPTCGNSVRGCLKWQQSMDGRNIHPLRMTQMRIMPVD